MFKYALSLAIVEAAAMLLPVGTAFGQEKDAGPSPVFDPRLWVSTIVREDLQAGYMANDNERFLRGERNVELLLAQRPEARADLTAWKAGIALKRAVEADEAERSGEFERQYRKARDLFAEAARLDPDGLGRIAVTAGSYSAFADRLPPRHRRDAWKAAYQAYSAMWRLRESEAGKLPLHFQGELLAGMAESAQRSGHVAESAAFLKRILATLPGTPYAAMAKRWIESPEIAARTKLTCQTCHDAGRLKARQAALAQSK
jgi:hypothetical protein